jgi:hypothetical protein
MNKVTDGKRYCRLHFVLVSFVPFVARVLTNLLEPKRTLKLRGSGFWIHLHFLL